MFLTAEQPRPNISRYRPHAVIGRCNVKDGWAND